MQTFLRYIAWQISSYHLMHLTRFLIRKLQWPFCTLRHGNSNAASSIFTAAFSINQVKKTTAKSDQKEISGPWDAAFHPWLDQGESEEHGHGEDMQGRGTQQWVIIWHGRDERTNWANAWWGERINRGKCHRIEVIQYWWVYSGREVWVGCTLKESN